MSTENQSSRIRDEAIRASILDHFVGLPNGYETPVLMRFLVTGSTTFEEDYKVEKI